MEHRRQLYLIYKEWLNNVVKYSGCTRVDIRLSVKNNQVHLLISDNGRGFDVNYEYSGNGLKNMKERAKSVNGSLVIRSGNGSGSVIDLKVPLV